MKHLLTALLLAVLGSCGTTTSYPPTTDTFVSDSAVVTNLPVGAECTESAQCLSKVCHKVSCNKEPRLFCAGERCDYTKESPCGPDAYCIYAGGDFAYCSPKTVCD